MAKSKLNYPQIVKLLGKHHQQHLLAFYDQLDSHQQNALLDQIRELDFKAIPGWIEQYVRNASPVVVPTELEPAPYYPARPDVRLADWYDKARKRGEELIRTGKVAAFVVAGGQGTRLGFDGPKGNFPISPIRKKTLFRIFAEMIAATAAKYGAAIPWYVMTSPQNHQATLDIFESEGYYGLNKADVCFFQQGTLPMFDLSGKILLAHQGAIATGPDGHGGSLKALHVSGALKDLKRRGIEYLSYWQIDNPLVKILDPLFIGLHDLDGAEMSSKTLIKAHPLEKVGNFCVVAGRINVIEYSDLSDEQAHRKNLDGTLTFELGSIAIHILSRSFVEQLNAKDCGLPLHRAVKKIAYIDERGNPIQPDKPNAVKLESFIFDALPLAKKSIILEILRSEEFAPVKNASGADSPEVTHRMLIERAATWLQSAGVKVPRKPDGSPDATIEIAPSFALGPEDIAAKLAHVPRIAPGQSVVLE
jgi:UDP-N-acetylglucosamine/UDP-N-acetylgalactosamine diphosphorylase